MHDADLYPLVFTPRFKEVVWGGRKLETVLGKPLPPERRIGESWELADLPSDQSVVANGPLAGVSLEQLVKQRPNALLGPTPLDQGRFPLLVKYIDAARTLSVQVHPDDTTAAQLGGRAKREAWYILDTEPGAVLYLGLQDGVSKAVLEDAIRHNTVEDLLVRVTPKPGDLIPVPPGTVHAIGAGLLLAEVQQPSDTTYRLYDWGRVGLDGKPRPLHIAEGVRATNPTARPTAFDPTDTDWPFRLQVHDLDSRLCTNLALDQDGPLVLVGLEGTAQIVEPRRAPISIRRGAVLLLPHSCRPAQVMPEGQVRLLLVSF